MTIQNVTSIPQLFRKRTEEERLEWRKKIANSPYQQEIKQHLSSLVAAWPYQEDKKETDEEFQAALKNFFK